MIDKKADFEYTPPVPIEATNSKHSFTGISKTKGPGMFISSRARPSSRAKWSDPSDQTGIISISFSATRMIWILMLNYPNGSESIIFIVPMGLSTAKPL